MEKREIAHEIRKEITFLENEVTSRNEKIEGSFEYPQIVALKWALSLVERE